MNPVGFVNGTKGVLLKDGVVVCGATSNGSSISRVLVESTNKCSEEFRTIIPNTGTRSYDHTFEGFWSDDAAFQEMVEDWKSGNKDSYKFVYGDAEGSKEDAFVAMIGSFSNGHEVDAPVSSTFTLKSSDSFSIQGGSTPPLFRQGCYYKFDGNTMYVELGRQVIPSPVNDEYEISWNTGSITEGSSQILAQQLNSLSSNTALEVSFNSSYKLVITVGGTSNVTQNIIKSNKAYILRLYLTTYELYEDGILVDSDTYTRGAVDTPYNTIIGQANTNTYVGVLFNVGIKPLNSSTFDPVLFLMDDDSDILVDQEGGASATIQNYDSNSWYCADAARRSNYYNFNLDEAILLNRQILDDPETDDFEVEFSTGSVVQHVARQFIISEGEGSANEDKNFAIVLITGDDLSGIHVILSGVLYSLGHGAVANSTYRINVQGLNWTLHENGFEVNAGTLPYRQPKLADNSFGTIGATRATSTQYTNGYYEVLYDVSITPLNSSTFEPFNYYIDSGIAFFIDRESGDGTSMANYTVSNWQDTP